MDYMDPNVRYPQKAIKLNHSPLICGHIWTECLPWMKLSTKVFDVYKWTWYLHNLDLHTVPNYFDYFVLDAFQVIWVLKHVVCIC